MNRIGLLLLSLPLISGSIQAAEIAEPILVDTLSITPPSGPGWRVIRRTEFGVVFARQPPEGPGNALAYVNTFQVSTPNEPSAFLNEMKEAYKKDFRAPGTSVGEPTFTMSNARGYYCVTVRNTVEAAATQQSRVVLCREPGPAPGGFAIGFSYGSKSPAPQLEAEADAFVSGVQLRK
jgi:hypothetical protein